MFSNSQQQNTSNLLQQSISSSNQIVISQSHSMTTTILALDNLNCGGIPTRTTPTLTPTTLRNIAADIVGLSPGPSEDFAAVAASDLQHLISSSCANVSSSGVVDRLSSDLQEHHSLQNLSNQQLSLQSLNNQHIPNLPNHQLLNQNSLNQQQRNDYNNSFSTAVSRQAGFVPPLVLQINSSITNTQQPTGTVLNTSANFISGKSSSNSSQWHGVVVTEKPYNSQTKCFTDDEGGDDDYESGEDGYSDCSETYSKKVTHKRKTKTNNGNSKMSIKSESKVNNGTTRRSFKDGKPMSAEEEQRRQVRRERNKLAAARCRKRRMDHTNELLEETEQLEDKRLKLQDEIQGLRQQKTDLQQMLAHHKCAVNNGPISNSINQAILDSNDISESDSTLLSNNDLSTIINTNNNIKIKKCEEHSVVQSNKDNINNIPTTVFQQHSDRTRPNTLSHFGNSKKNCRT